MSFPFGGNDTVKSASRMTLREARLFIPCDHRSTLPSHARSHTDTAFQAIPSQQASDMRLLAHALFKPNLAPARRHQRPLHPTAEIGRIDATQIHFLIRRVATSSSVFFNVAKTSLSLDGSENTFTLAIFAANIWPACCGAPALLRRLHWHQRLALGFDQTRLIANSQHDFVVVIEKARGNDFAFRRVGVAAERPAAPPPNPQALILKSVLVALPSAAAT